MVIVLHLFGSTFERTICVALLLGGDLGHGHHLSLSQNTVSESTVSNTELSEFFVPSLSSGERAQRVRLSLLLVCKSKLTEFSAELTKFAPQRSVSSLFQNRTLSKQCSAHFLLCLSRLDDKFSGAAGRNCAENACLHSCGSFKGEAVRTS